MAAGKLSKPHLEILDDKHALAERAAELLTQTVSAAAAERGKYAGRTSVALAGGTTPRLLYQLLSHRPWHQRIPWDRIQWIVGDERVVPPDHEDSNFRMVYENLFDPAGVREDHHFRVMTELPTPQAAAADYMKRLQAALGITPGSGTTPSLDLMLLGMGSDGHTASLFPHTDALREREKIVLANWVEKLDSWRITVTPPVLEGAKRILVLVSGEDKAKALFQVLKGEWNPEEYPAQILRDLPSVAWIVDKAAAVDIT